MPIRSLRFLMHFAPALALSSVLGSAPAAAAVIWVGPSGTGCDTTNLGAAVLIAAFSSSDDAIHLADGISHTNINLALNGFDPDGSQGSLAIRGGFASCGDATPTTGRTLIDGDSADPIFEILSSSGGASVVELVDLELTGAGVRALELDDGADVSLVNIWIHDNAGGVRVRGTGRMTMDSQSWVFDNSVSGGFGGGISCNESAVVVVGGPVSGNFAGQWGGGIFAGGSCQLTLQGKAWVQGNTATFNGGGLAANGLAIVNTGEAAQGILIRNNTAENGGGVYVDEASVGLSNTTIDLNEAERGAAIYATNDARVSVGRSSIFPCQDALRCSSISFNRLGDDVFGAVGWVDAGASLFISQTFVEGNDSSSGRDNELFLWTLEDAGSFVSLENVTIWGNEARFIATSLSGNQSSIALRNVTIGGNFYPSSPDPDEPIGLFTGTDATSASVFGGLFWNMGETIGTYGGICVLADNADALSLASASATISDPRFLDLAGGDLRLHPDSPAVDACLDGESEDIEGQARAVDVPTNANGNPGQTGGIFDAGSDEVIPTGMPAGEIRLVDTFREVQESDESVFLRVERINGSDGPVGVFFEATSGTALEDMDFSGDVAFTQLWDDGETGIRNVAVADIIDDAVQESVEEFTVELSIFSGDATLGTPFRATVRILDNDGDNVFSDGFE